MLREIKKWILDRKIVSLYDLSLHFQVDQSAMEKMMEKLEEKGIVCKKQPDSCSVACSECAVSSCQASKMVFFEIN